MKDYTREDFIRYCRENYVKALLVRNGETKEFRDRESEDLYVAYKTYKQAEEFFLSMLPENYEK